MRNSDNYGEITRKAKVKHGIWTGVKYFFLALWAIIVLFPFYWMVLTSLKDYGAYNSEYIPKFFTLYPTLANYAEAFTAVPLARYFMNTLLFTVVTTALMLIVITLAAFAFARLEFRGKRIANPNTHGTGCTLSSAIASNLAKGYDLDTAVERAKAYISGCLSAMLDLGHGSGPMDHTFNLKGDFVRD